MDRTKVSILCQSKRQICTIAVASSCTLFFLFCSIGSLVAAGLNAILPADGDDEKSEEEEFVKPAKVADEEAKVAQV